MTDFDYTEEDELADLRKRAKRVSYEKGLAMLEDPSTPATARASLVRAFLADAASRSAEEAQPALHNATVAEIDQMLADLKRQTRSAPRVIDITPDRAVGGVFD